MESGGVSYRGVDYHVNDFVYHHNSEGNLLHIGQIVEFLCDLPNETPSVHVRQFGRYNHIVKDKTLPSDNVCDFYLPEMTFVDIMTAPPLHD